MMTSRKKLGILGGMGSEATQVFLKCIFDNTLANCDQEHLDILLYNHASLPDRTGMILQNHTQELSQMLCGDVKMLAEAGCEYIAIPCNTCHFFAKELSQIGGTHFINMIEETVNLCKDRGAKKVGILATDGTVKSKLYADALQSSGIASAVPSEQVQQSIMHIIYNQVKKGLPADVQLFSDAADSLFSQGCDTVILGCTELSVVKNEHKLTDARFVDALEVLSRACIRSCGGTLRK